MEHLQGIIQNSGLITVRKLSHPLGLNGRELPDRTWDKANPQRPGRQEIERVSCYRKSGFQLLDAQKPISRLGWWKERFGLFPMPATGEVAKCLSKGQVPRRTISGQQFYRWGRGVALYAETVQSALTGILKLVMGGLTSIILIVLGTVNLQFQNWFVSISLSSILRIVAADITATVWS